MVASLVPSPVVNVRPVVCAKVIRPWATDIVIFTALLAASTSATLIPVIESSVSSLTDFAPGTVSTGASFTALTVIVTVPVSLWPAASFTSYTKLSVRNSLPSCV